MFIRAAPLARLLDKSTAFERRLDGSVAAGSGPILRRCFQALLRRLVRVRATRGLWCRRPKCEPPAAFALAGVRALLRFGRQWIFDPCGRNGAVEPTPYRGSVTNSFWNSPSSKLRSQKFGPRSWRLRLCARYHRRSAQGLWPDHPSVSRMSVGSLSARRRRWLLGPLRRSLCLDDNLLH
jgi:hypothetical protein